MEYQNIKLKSKFRDLKSLPRKEAREFFNYFLKIKDKRVEFLSQEIRNTKGYKDFKLDFSSNYLQDLENWYKEIYEKVNKSDEFIKSEKESLNIKVHPNIDNTWDQVIEVKKYTASEKSFSYAIDIYIYIGEIILKEYPDLKWELCSRSKKYIHYHEPVIEPGIGNSFSPISCGLSDAEWLANNTWDFNLEVFYQAFVKNIEMSR